MAPSHRNAPLCNHNYNQSDPALTIYLNSTEHM